MASAAIGVSIPIFEGGALRAQVEIATAHQAQAVARYGSVVLTAFREVEDALANEQLLAESLPFDESALGDRTEAVRIATVQYLAGRRDLLWVSNLQTGQIATQAALIRLRGLQRVNRVRSAPGAGRELRRRAGDSGVLIWNRDRKGETLKGRYSSKK